MITIEQVVPDHRIDHLHRLYHDTFEPIKVRAAMRHMLTDDEFAAEMRDPRIDKYIAWDPAGQVTGLATITNDLACIPWIEPQFLAARHPAQTADRTVFYLGYVLVARSRANVRVIETLVLNALRTVAEVGGAVAFDASSFTMGRLVSRLAARVPQAIGVRVPRQRTAPQDEVQPARVGPDL